MFGPIIQRLVKTTIKNSINFELAIDPLISKFSNQCPPRNELNIILQQKNLISKALNQTQTSLTTLTDTSNSLEKILKALKAAIRIIKLLPIPTAVPPGIGIPLNIINNFSSVLDNLGKIIEKGEGTVEQVIPAANIISKQLLNINTKLNILDLLLINCLEKETIGMTLNEKQDFFTNLGLEIQKKDEISVKNLNTSTNNPYIYKDFKIIIDTDTSNPFSFPRRRAIGNNIKNNIKIYGPYSYSSSTQVLIDSLKFEIDVKFPTKN
jgi:hypothetical protein